MAVDQKQKIKIVVDVEAGKLNKTKIAQKWRISRNTLNKIIAEAKAGFGINEQKLNKKIEEAATKKIVDREADKLFDANNIYVKNLEIVEKGIKANMASFFYEVKASKNNLSKADADRLKTAQQFLECVAKTYKINLEGRRIAMGLGGSGKDGGEGSAENRIQKRMNRLKNVN